MPAALPERRWMDITGGSSTLRLTAPRAFFITCSDAIAAMAHKISALRGGEETECRRHERVDVIESARARRAQERCQFTEGEFDGIEIGTVGRQKAQLGADALERKARQIDKAMYDFIKPAQNKSSDHAKVQAAYDAFIAKLQLAAKSGA